MGMPLAHESGSLERISHLGPFPKTGMVCNSLFLQLDFANRYGTLVCAFRWTQQIDGLYPLRSYF
jgi:hypothetical protein